MESCGAQLPWGFVGDLAGARVGGGGLGGPVAGWAVRPSWSAGSGISRCSEWQGPAFCFLNYRRQRGAPSLGLADRAAVALALWSGA